MQNGIKYGQDAQLNSAEDTAQQQKNTDNASKDHQSAVANAYYDSQEKAVQPDGSDRGDGSGQLKEGTNAPPPQSDDAGSDQKTRSQTMAGELLKKWRPADMNNWDAAWAGRWAAQEIIANQQWDKLPKREDCNLKDPFWQRSGRRTRNIRLRLRWQSPGPSFKRLAAIYMGRHRSIWRLLERSEDLSRWYWH